MWESANTTASNTIGFNSQLSFYEYPSHKPFINSVHQPLRPSHTLSKTAVLPESNRDDLLTALQSLSLKIKSLESERQKAQSNLREITGDICRTRHGDSANHVDEQRKEVDKDLNRFDGQNGKSCYLMNNDRTKKVRSGRKKKRSTQHNDTFDVTSGINFDGRHYHLDMNTVPFILGASTAPSHNVKSNVQNVIALLKGHNHQLCLSSKEYSEFLQPHVKGDLSPHTLLYLDNYNKSSSPPINRPSSASPVRSIRRSRTTSSGRPHSACRRRPQTATVPDHKCYSKMKRLRQEFATLAREHKKLNTSRTNPRELQIISRRMEMILDELEQLQRQLKISIRKSISKDQFQTDKSDTPLETLRKTRLLQLFLKDSSQKEQHQTNSYRRTRPNSND